MSVVAVAFVFAVFGASLGAVSDRASSVPVLSVGIGFALALGLAVRSVSALAFRRLYNRFVTSPQERDV
jgi:hypothetical protein